MPAATPQDHFSAVLADYLSSSAALAVSGVPSLTTLPRRSARSDTALTRPFVRVEVDVEQEGSEEMLTLSITLHLEAQIGSETHETTRANAYAYLGALRALLHDDHRSTWDAFLAAEDDDYRDGWACAGPFFPQGVSDEYDTDSAVLTLRAGYRAAVFWNHAI